MLDKINDKVLSTTSGMHAVMDFLEACPPFVKRINSKMFRRLAYSLKTCQLWPSLLVFLEQTSHLLPNLPSTVVCSMLELVVEHEGVSEKVVEMVEQLTEDQRESLNCQVLGDMGDEMGWREEC